jgi:uncharacterized protein (DUF2141 family)
MKSFIQRAVLLLALTAAGQAADLTVIVSGLRGGSGFLRVALFESAKGFPGEVTHSLTRQSLDLTAHPKGQPVTVVFKNLPDKKYAVSLFHDEDADGKLKTSWLRTPREGTGTSNNPPRRLGPPEFESSSFEIRGDRTISVVVSYEP